MPATFDWDNAEEIGIQLAEKYPDADPLTVRYTDLHKMDHRPSTDSPAIPSSPTRASSKRFRWPGSKSTTSARRDL